MGNLPRARRASRPANERILAVEAGQVVCPRRGIVDIAECWLCPAYLGMSGGHVEGLVCSTEPVTSFAGRPATQ
jgi:hypothetical protein